VTALRVIPTTDAATTAASVLIEELRAAASVRDRVSLAVSGGDTPWETLARLQPADLDWSRIDVFQVDERVAPRDDRARNLSRLESALLSRVPATAHPMPVEHDDLDSAAADYAAALPGEIDVVLLGLGTDGHTASLVPGDAALASPATVAVTSAYAGHRRMTLTYTALNRAHRIIWLVTGARKRDALAALLDGTSDIPANRVARDRALVIADAAALGR
jgi:6-phosphogluconolactonase